MQENKIEYLISEKYKDLTLDEQKLIHELYHKEESERTEMYESLHNLVFKLDPPTPEQFLNPQYGWFPKNFTDALYPHVIDDFIEILSFEKKYNQIVEYGSTRLGKTYLLRLIIMYIIVFGHCLRHPQLYYNLAPTTILSIYIMCFVAEKTKQLLLKPIYDLFTISERFKRIHLQDKVREEQYKIGNETIVWSKAAHFGELTLASNMTINLGTDFMSFIGADLLFLAVSEISFFTEKLGATHEEIFQIYSDGLARIKATVGKRYLGSVFLDTSANTADNPIEQYILNDLQYQPKVFFRRRNQWEARPYLFPEWQKTGETFKVFLGDSNIPCKILQNNEVSSYPTNLIISPPIDAKEEFERNTNKAIKDIAGIPTILENKLICNKDLILKIFDNSLIKNIEGLVIAEAKQQPEKLLWNQIKDLFFIKNTSKEGKYIIYRAPTEPRYIGIDLSHSIKGDLQAFCLGHKEWYQQKQCIIYVIDFCFPIGAKESAINLEAPFELIFDLIIEAELSIKAVFCDSFQSQTAIQKLQRNNIDMIKQSVDLSINPYQYYLTTLTNNLIKCGRNIFLLNNIQSLIHTKRNNIEKIDHTKGKVNHSYTGNFETSDCGINEKDCSDANCQFLWGAKGYDEHIPSVIYEDENKRFSNDKNIIELNIKNAWKMLHNSSY